MVTLKIKNMIEQQQAQEVEENSPCEVYDPVEKVVDSRKLKPTDMRNNPRVGLPKARLPKEERLIAAREVLRDQVFSKYKVQEWIMFSVNLTNFKYRQG